VKIYLFYHSVVSDWNHGNAHFLRGLTASLIALGHNVQIMEPKDGWSFKNLLMDYPRAEHDFREVFPYISPVMYSEKSFEPVNFLNDAELVIVHEWNDPEVVNKIGAYRKINKKMILLFHDTHHRSVTKPDEMSRYDLRNYDGVLAFGDVIRNIYLKRSWARNVWTWHEAADDRIFHPVISREKEGDLVWIGNWGEDERTEELEEFIIEPVRQLKLKAGFYGVRYPSNALKLLKKAKIRYRGWIPNYKVPVIFGKYRMTVHVPRRPYVESLPGIPTIRPFEALACGIPLICSPWNDREHLFTPGKDFLVAQNGADMVKLINDLMINESQGRSLALHGLETIRRKHTCDHRAWELMRIVNEIELIRSENLIHKAVRT
jgi:spore maturation protein CgeB